MANRQNLSSKLAKARRQLQNAQIQVAALEAALREGLPVLANSEDHYARESETLHSSEVAEQDEQLQQAAAVIQRYAARLEILHQIDIGIINARSIEAVVETALKHIRAFFACQQAFVGVFDDATNESVIFACDVNTPFEIGKGTRLPTRRSVFDEFGTGKVVVIDDLQRLPESQPAYASVKKAGLRSALRAALTFQGHPIGLLALNAAPPGFFTLEHQEIAAEIADQLAIAIHQLHLSEQLARHTAELEKKVAARTADLTEAKQRVEAILNNSLDGILLVAPDLTIQQTNSAVSSLFAAPPDHYLGKSLVTLFSAADVARVTDLMAAVVAEERGQRIEIRALRKNGTGFDAELKIGFIKGDGMVCTLNDITERKAQERQLRYHASLQASVSDAVIVIDAENIIQSWNKAAENIYGWRAEEAVGKAAPAFLRYESSPEQHARDMQYLQEHGWVKGEIRQFHKDGHLIHIWSSITAIQDEQGNILSFIAINHDITEHKRHERQLRYHASIQESVSDAVIATDMDFRIQSWNRAAETIYGWNAVEAIGKSANELLQTIYESEVDRTRLLQDFLERGAWQGEIIQHHRDGHPITILASVSLFKDELGQPLGLVSVNRDITERRQAQQAIIKSEARYRLLAENIADIIMTFSLDRRITYMSPSCEALLGYLPEEVEGISHSEFIHPEDYPQVLDKTRQAVVAKASFYTNQFRLRHKAGHYLWYEVRTRIVFNDNSGNVVQFISILRDITERKRMEDALQIKLTEERQFQHNLKALHEIIIELTGIEQLDTFYRRAVELGRERLGFERLAMFLYDERDDSAVGTYGTDIQGNVVDERGTRFTPNPNGVMQRSFDRIERFYLNEATTLYNNEVPIGHGWNAAAVLWNGSRSLGWFVADNLLSHVPASKSLLDIIGIYALSVGTLLAQKQTQLALKASEEKYRTLVETMRGGLAVFDPAFRITFVNDRFCELLGYSSTEVIGKQPSSFVDTADLPLVQLHLERRQRAESSSYEIPVRHKDGHQIYLLMSGSPLLDKQGNYNGSIVVATDITIQKQAEDALHRALAKEKELGDLKTRFVSMASHEFRTPLTVILALVETLSLYRHKLSDEQIDERVEKIKGQIEHLTAIMEDVLMLSRMQARHVECNPVQLDLDALARTILEEFQDQPDLTHHLAYTVSGGIQELWLDRKLMRQIISNLLSNAIKYSSAGTVVRIHLAYIDAAVMLTVSDEGIGIPEADLPHLFTPFHRADNVGGISGTGLGLVITREAVELQGGTITVESQQGVGTTFLVHMPVRATATPSEISIS